MPRSELSPTQHMIAERVVSVLATAQIVTLRTSPGAGKSTLLRHLQQHRGTCAGVRSSFPAP